MSARMLADGPRGRHVVVAAASRFDPAIWTAWVEAAWAREAQGGGRNGRGGRLVFYGDGDREQAASRLQSPKEALRLLQELLEGFDCEHFARLTDPLDLVVALDRAVSSAMYWQPPDDQDRILAHRVLRPTLERLSAALLASPATAWWPTRCDLAVQRWSGRRRDTGDHAGAPPLQGAADTLLRWSRDVPEEELRARSERPADPEAAISGNWWSSPRGLRTTRALPGLGAVDLVLVEDGLGETDAEVSTLEPSRDVRVLEIDGPEAWVELVAAHPVDVTRSRLHDWYRTTGCTGPWRIPDWSAVAADWDAVHLTVLGYLAAATRARPVGDAFTMIAGWGPDETLWLTDALRIAGAVERWRYPPVPGPDARWERVR